MQTTKAEDLRSLITSGDEYAVIDVREEGVFSKRHLFVGSCIPLSHLEMRAPAMLPRKSVAVVVIDGGGEDLAERGARRLVEMGYSSVAVLDGGVEAWADAGFEVFSGVNVPSKAFGEFVEHYYDTPRIAAADLEALRQKGEDIVILDSRPMPEFNRMSIPGGIDCPGAELVYRVGMMAPDPETTVIVNCAGRTRSIIGAQSLINAGIPNKVMALKDGTMGWELAGMTCARGEDAHAPPPNAQALKTAEQRAADVAKRFGVARISAGDLRAWQADTMRTTFLFDVRTPQEFEAGHWPGARHAPGGQLVQATDEFVGVRNARIVLTDGGDGVRATMTASWLIQLGYGDVKVLTDQPAAPETGPCTAKPALFKAWRTIAPDALNQALLADDGRSLMIVDLADSASHRKQHIPGAAWGVRARLPQFKDIAPDGARVVLTSPCGQLAHYAAHELAELRADLDIAVLDGGTTAWIDRGFDTASGIEQALTQTDDVWPKPYDQPERMRDAMEEYLTWEVGLVEQVERDGLVTFTKYA